MSTKALSRANKILYNYYKEKEEIDHKFVERRAAIEKQQRMGAPFLAT